MKKFVDYHQWEDAVRASGLMYAPAADRGAPAADRGAISNDIDIAFKKRSNWPYRDSYVDYGVFSLKNSFGVLFETAEELQAWLKVT